MYRVIFYETARGDKPVKDFLRGLDKKTRTKVYRCSALLEQFGPNLIRPYADVVRGKIRELRVTFSHDNVRVLYFFAFRTDIVLLHGFLKKTQRLDPGDIELAERRMVDWLSRYDDLEEATT